MAVYHFTFHAYRTWNADHPRGLVRRGEGILPPDDDMARKYDRRAAGPITLFGPFCQQVLVWIAYDACARRQWRLHFVATEPTHVHILLSWRGYQPWEEVSDRLKNLASLMLGRKLGRPQGKWFSRKASRKRVRDRKHFDFLVNEYLPRHRGLKWREGDPPAAIMELSRVKYALGKSSRHCRRAGHGRVCGGDRRGH